MLTTPCDNSRVFLSMTSPWCVVPVIKRSCFPNKQRHRPPLSPQRIAFAKTTSDAVAKLEKKYVPRDKRKRPADGVKTLKGPTAKPSNERMSVVVVVVVQNAA